MTQAQAHPHPQPHPARRVRLQVITKLIAQGGGHYQTYSSKYLPHQHYDEGAALEVIENDTSEIPLNAVIVPVVCLPEVVEIIRDVQAGNDAEREPDSMAIVDGTAFWEDTGAPFVFAPGSSKR